MQKQKSPKISRQAVIDTLRKVSHFTFLTNCSSCHLQ